ncbi:hypothetical protein, partial [Thiolapillus sp.]
MKHSPLNRRRLALLVCCSLLYGISLAAPNRWECVPAPGGKGWQCDAAGTVVQKPTPPLELPATARPTATPARKEDLPETALPEKKQRTPEAPPTLPAAKP